MRPLPALMTTHMMINQIKNLPPTNSPVSSPNYAMLVRKTDDCKTTTNAWKTVCLC
jgi:hypothetical protein